MSVLIFDRNYYSLVLKNVCRTRNLRIHFCNHWVNSLIVFTVCFPVANDCYAKYVIPLPHLHLVVIVVVVVVMPVPQLALPTSILLVIYFLKKSYHNFLDFIDSFKCEWFASPVRSFSFNSISSSRENCSWITESGINPPQYSARVSGMSFFSQKDNQ